MLFKRVEAYSSILMRSTCTLNLYSIATHRLFYSSILPSVALANRPAEDLAEPARPESVSGYSETRNCRSEIVTLAVLVSFRMPTSR